MGIDCTLRFDKISKKWYGNVYGVYTYFVDEEDECLKIENGLRFVMDTCPVIGGLMMIFVEIVSKM